MSKRNYLLTERIPLAFFGPFLDFFAVVLGGFLAHHWRFGLVELPERYIWAVTVIALLIVIINLSSDAYKRWRTRRFYQILSNLIFVWMLVAIVATSIIYFLHVAERYSRLWLLTTMLLSFLIAVGGRAFVRVLLFNYRLKGRHRRKAFLIGPGETLLNITRHMRHERGAGFSISGVHRLNGSIDEAMLGLISSRVEKSKTNEVWICMPLSMGSVVKEIMHTLRHQAVEIRFFPELKDLPLLNHRVSHVVGLYSIDLSVSPMTGQARFIKRVEDLVLSFLILLFISPLMLALAMGVKLSSRGPVFYKQERVSWNGKPFNMLKFRSMPVDVEKDEVQWGGAKGKTTTRFGAFIRKASLDELPQFINVLKGDMSIVGPRPERTVFVHQFKHEVVGYMQKHMVKAGITGWAQINGWRGDTDLRKRIEFDLWYIDNWSLLLDLKIIFLTLVKGFFGKNAC